MGIKDGGPVEEGLLGKIKKREEKGYSSEDNGLNDVEHEKHKEPEINKRGMKENSVQGCGCRGVDEEKEFKELHEHKQPGNKDLIIKGNIKVKHRSENSKIERVATGIPGVDGVIEGGLKKDSVTLVGGCAGSGKSIFATQFIVDGIQKYDEPGIYITFEEDRKDFYEDMQRFGWDLSSMEEQGNFVFMRYTPEQVGKLLKTGGGVVRDVIDKIKAKRVVIDSISAFTLLYGGELEKREASLELFKILKKWDCTTIVIGQYCSAESRSESAAAEFEVDAIVWLYNIKKENIRVRALEIFKMRGTKHSAKMFPFQITEDGIITYPDEIVF